MSQLKPKGGRAVMNRRLDPRDSLDFFPTPPWATRALLTHVIPLVRGGRSWDGCAGEGHMAEVLREYFDDVHASDVHDYGNGYSVGSFAGKVDVPQAPALCPFQPNWIIMNPPFEPALEFALRAIDEATDGAALLVRTPWAEGIERYERLFRDRPPTTIAHFVERVPMVKGCWDPDATTATAYSWFVWAKRTIVPRYGATWIPPGCRVALEHTDDCRRFAAWTFEVPANDNEEAHARELIDMELSPDAMRQALGISKDRLTRFLRDIAKKDKQKQRIAA